MNNPLLVFGLGTGEIIVIVVVILLLLADARYPNSCEGWAKACAVSRKE